MLDRAWGADARGAVRPAGSEWRYWGGDQAFTRYSPLDQITRGNVGELKIAWRQAGVDPALKEAFPDLRVSGNFRSTPIMVNGVLYAPNARRPRPRVRSRPPARPAGSRSRSRKTIEEISRPSPRGVEYWKNGGERAAVPRARRVPLRVDAQDRRVHRGVRRSGPRQPALGHPLAALFSWTAGPIVVNDVIVVAGATAGAGDGGVKKEATPEDIRGFDVRTGKLLWTFHVVPQAGEFGVDTWGEESYAYSGDLASWCCLTRGRRARISSTSRCRRRPASSTAGTGPATTSSPTRSSRSTRKTGKRVWHFQMVHHDLWDYDTVGPATLGEITVDGRRIKAVMQPSKTGFLYVFDRATGKPVWPIEERPVPQSTVPRRGDRRRRSRSRPSRRRSIARASPRTT